MHKFFQKVLNAQKNRKKTAVGIQCESRIRKIVW